jgi:hypothetical protein
MLGAFALASSRRLTILSGMYAQTKRSDFSVAITNRGKLKNPWRWELYRAGKSTSIAVSWDSFPTMGAALQAGKQALAELFEKHHIRE